MKKSIVKNISLGIACLFGLGASISAVLFTNSVNDQTYEVVKALDAITYIERSWNGTSVSSTEKSVTDYTVVTESTTSWSNGWYVVDSDVTISSRILVTGTVNLILCNGKTIRASKGITVSTHSSIADTLNIYGQSADTGKINAFVATDSTNLDERQSAAIGGSRVDDLGPANGYINIYGGTINAVGGKSGDSGAAIGCANNSVLYRPIKIYGGTITAGLGESSVAAAIGSGASSTFSATGSVYIYGGNITSTGGTEGGAGIGGGKQSAGGPVSIYGGFVSATGGGGAAGIGAGSSSSNHGELNVVSNLIVYGGDSENPTEVINPATTRTRYMVVKNAHTHNWSYSVNNYSIHATCTASDCPIDPADPSLNLSIQQQNFVFDTNPKNISFVDGYSTDAFGSGVNVTYLQNDTPIGACVNAGQYEARVTIGGATISSSFTIAQATPSYIKPTDLEATYGDDLSSVTLPSTWNWKTPTDKVGDAGNREHVAIYTPTDPNYKTVEDTLTVTVNTADPDIPTNLEATYGDTLSNITLPAGWAWTDATTNVGNVGTRNFDAHYTAVDGNHHDKDASLTIKVNQATPTGYDIPTDLSATYNDKLSSVVLPTNWSWKTPTDTVGNAGNNNHIAIYTPTDPNYKAVEETLTVKVNKATPTGYVVPTNLEAPNNTSLSNITLPEGFSWMDDTQKTTQVGSQTFKAKYIPTDTANYNIVENIDITINVKWTMVDPSTSGASVTIDGADEEFTTDITVRVEIKTEISVDQKRTDYAPLADNNFVNKNEDIAAIYDVKLIRTINGVETEIQPSDIKPGTKIIVSMNVPEELLGKDFRLLHIHSQEDIAEINKNEFILSSDDKTLTLEVDRLSEFAFITATNTDNGFIYQTGLPAWGVLLIVLGSILLLGILALLILYIFFPVYYIDYSKKEVRRAIYIRTKHGEVLMLNTHLAKVRRNETDVYEKKSDALKALNK